MQHSSRKLLRITLITLLVLGGSIYIYSRLDAFLGGPSITISVPHTISSVWQTETITVSGTALNVINLTLNRNNITVDQHNEFNELLPLLPGFNILEVQAQDRFGRTETQTRYVVYQPSEKNVNTTATSTS